MKILILTNMGFERTISRMKQMLINEGHDIVTLHERLDLERLSQIKPDLIICQNYAFIISKDVISYMNGNVVNMHPSLLPECRGLHPHLWSLLTHVPSGVSLHFINEEIDKGPIIAQERIIFDTEQDTIRSSYQEIQTKLEDLFISAWANYDSWKSIAIKPASGGEYYSKKDYLKIKHLITDWNMPINEFVDAYRKSLS